ncbi:MAG: NERD domain-containing protein [Acidobacteria bacterium]|nr:NERD domain-containing protein [Acidobacteriota bacterium]
MLANHIALYIGSPIEHESERAVLIELLRLLEMSGVAATVLANINLKGRQLDLVLGTDRLTLVLEAKACTAPLRGSENGSWSTLTRSGRWKTTRNAYLQALDEKNALRDALREHQGEVTGYPDAHVVFVPGLAPGSELPSDHKVTFSGIEGIASQLAQHSGLCCTAEQWRAFADRQGLERVFDLASAWDQRLLDAQRTLAQYIAAFTATYASTAAQYKPDTYDVDGESLGVPDLERLLLQTHEDLLIQGPSGCGKSLLSLVLANRLCIEGVIPVVVEGKAFEGQLGSALDREATLLDVQSASKLLAAARLLTRQVSVIVDGYNECPADQRFRLTRALRAASVKFDATIIVSSQIAIDRADLLPLRQVTVTAPSQELKVAIASIDAVAAEVLAPLLQTISTGIEASLIGRMGHAVTRVSSRFALFDGFVRRRLGNVASQGVTLLSRVAELLFERMTFSLSTREVDRILVKERIGVEVLQEIRHTGLLVLREDRLSFVHEMYLSAFAAEAVVRQVGSDREALTKALAMPRFNELRAFVVGAIEDGKLLAHLLGATTDTSLLQACMLGECGIDAQQFTKRALDTILGRLQDEVEFVRFFIASDQMWEIGVEPASRTDWTEHERALLSVLPAALAHGLYCSELLEVVGRFDQRLREEFTRLRSDAVQKGMKLLRSSLFAVAYVFGQRELGISLVMSLLHGGSLARLFESPERQAILRSAWLNAATPGQFYLALALSRSGFRLKRDVLELAIERTLPLLEIQRWKFLPYHLQLDLMNFVHFLPREDTSVSQKLAQALEGLLPELNPLFQGIAVESLSGLGAMDDELKDHEIQVRGEVAKTLGNPAAENAAEIAWSIYNAQFDHPFDAAYINVIEDLSDDQRMTLMRLACAGASEHSFFLGSLMERLAHAGDLLAVPAISRWARLPNRDSSMRQNAVEIYIAALMALGQLQSDLSADICPMGLGPREDAMSACGMIYYWLQRHTSDAAAAEPVVAAAFETLSANPSLAIGVLSDISRSIMGADKRGVLLITAFPDRAVMLARAALQRGGSLEGYFPGPSFFGEGEAERFAISIVGSYGSADDVPLLRTFVDHVHLSGSARKALAAIETRASSAA